MEKSLSKVLFSSIKMDWETPKNLFDSLNKEFNFTLDAAANKDNKKCDRYLGSGSEIAENALDVDWGINEVIWLNPPYGRELKKWIKKAYEQSKYNTVVLLIPSRTDTAYWHDYCIKGEIRYIRGRLKFSNSKNSAPFPSALVIFK